jgi:hypothetical protein
MVGLFMTLGRVGWIGVILVVLGWALLLLGSPLLRLIDGIKLDWLVGSTTIDPEVIGHDMILTGIGLAIIGTLQTGFSALTRFFDAVLKNIADSPISAAPPPLKSEPKRTRITEFGVIVLDDGSIEVETILGTRRFASFAEAREFMDA